MRKNQYLLVELNHHTARFWFSEEFPSKSFVLNGQAYLDQGFGDWLGFYDFLRNSNGEILGVRNFIDDFSVQTFSDLPRVQINNEPNAIEIFFSDSRNVDESKSDDQWFGDNKLYQSENGDYLITFHLVDTNFARDCQISPTKITKVLPKVA